VSDSPRFGSDPKPFYLAFGVLFLLELVRRAFLAYVPDDFTAYLAASDVFVHGGDPYTHAIFDAVRYQGKPYNYFPGTLYLVAPLAWVSTTAAVTLDWVARGVVLVATLRWLGRRLVPDTRLHFVFLLAVLHEPLMIDLLFGNMVTYLLGAWAACVWVSERPPSGRDRALVFVCGIVLCFKPFWLLPAAWALVVRRRWTAVALLGCGAGLVVGASFTLPSMLPHFLSHTQQMRAFYHSVDLLALAPPLLPVALAVWAAGAVWLFRNGPREAAFVFGCASIPVWPRLATYSYVMTLPLILFLARRYGWFKTLAWSVVLWGPVPWLLRVAPWMPGERLENWVQFSWSIVTAVVVFLALRDAARTPEAADAGAMA